MSVALDGGMAKSRRKEYESPSAGEITAATLERDRVAQRAYELYLTRGGGAGQELDDWLCAERELQNASAGRTERS
jgi:hypothetical protein